MVSDKARRTQVKHFPPQAIKNNPEYQISHSYKKNNALYQKTGETPISLIILEARWRLSGHILRQAINTPPNVATTKYFKTEGSKQRGRPKTSIVTTLRRDLKSHNNDHWPTKLHSINDLDHLRDIAQNRSDWKHLTTAVYKSAQAETSVDVAADGH
ncbi:endonuclease-reverse transcriptase [Elysia marginata]|uniref:Endonuclease-reverse transcriptase n=1 Tax=Elysia marginata TaxID=1093978 RepID=A0AAV4JWN9_9GAST|nr:endonuclease-reverse transcriptase [Elysia marginata]